MKLNATSLLAPHALAIMLSALLVDAARGDQSLTQSDLLSRVIDVERLMFPAAAPDATRVQSGAVGAGDSTAPKPDPEGWTTIYSAEGAGYVARIFFAAPGGELRISIDGAPAITAPLTNLFDGKIAPIEGPITHRTSPGGAGVCYFPLGHAKNCRIDVRNTNSSYQISGVRSQRPIAAFSSRLDDAGRETLEHVNKTLAGGYSEKRLFAGKKLMPVLGSGEIKPGDALTEQLDGAGTIRALYVNFPDRRPTLIPGLLHQVIVRIFFDREAEPAVEAPLPDFFGSGLGIQDCAGLLCGTRKWIDVPADRVNQNEFCYAYFPMPYRKGVRIEFKNQSDTKIELTYFLRVQLGEPPESALRFHARFRRDHPLKTSEYLCVDTTGPGRFLGLVLSADSPRYDWWGDGGETIRIDGKEAAHSADFAYAVGDVAPLHLISTALHGATRVATAGKSSAYRWHLSDSMCFDKSLRVTLGAPAGAKNDLYLSSVAFWYAPPDAKHKFRPLKSEDTNLTTLRLPGAVEIEGNVVGEGWGREVKQRDAMGVEYSAGSAALIESTSAVAIDIPVAKARSAKLKLRVNAIRGFDRIEVTDISGKPIGSAVFSREQTTGIYEIGAIELKSGANRVRVICSKPAVLDCWLLE
ncbi:MAG: DUF2961 domain-containing protein [Phycisphaerales bacterium]|nr:DUF2961 domain-containing protein [Phycisphaerales bacterium]